MGFWDTLNDARVNARKKFVEFADLFGGNTEGGMMDPNHQMHSDVSHNLTKSLGKYIPPELSGNLADMAGLGNEVASGHLKSLANAWEGKPQNYFSEAGFDFGDVGANRVGQDQAEKELNQEEPLAKLDENYNVKWNPKKLYINALQGATGMSGLNTVAKGLRKLPFTY